MSRFITTSDYEAIIRDAHKTMVTDDNAAVLALCESTALEDIAGYLRFDFDVDAILGHRVFEHSLTATYLAFDLVVTSTGVWYVALQNVPVSTALSNAAYWLKDEMNHPLAHAATTAFTKGDTVTGIHGEKYLVLQDTTGAALTDTETFWLKRNESILMCALHISLYYLHHRISAKQIPEWRLLAYEQSLAKLKAIRKKEINPGLPLLGAELAPEAVGSIVIEGNTKQDNSWA